MWITYVMTWFLYITIIFNSVCQAGEVTQGHNEVVVLEGQEADLPCVTTPTQGNAKFPRSRYTSTHAHTPDHHHQRPQLILWYRDGIRSTIYSYDGRDPGRERHWSERRSLGGALELTLPPTPHSRPQLAFLRISRVHQSDEGLYRCRVDFYRAPSRNTNTKLVIVAPPSTPRVEVWASGRWLEAAPGTPAATVEVGTRLRLRCSTTAGRPAPTLTWWRGGEQLLEEKTEVTKEKVMEEEEEEEVVVRSTLHVSVRPEDAHTPVVCQASNTHLTPPLRTPLHLLVLSSPSWVRVVGADKAMSAGVSYTVECRSVGARPPPVLSWSVGDHQHIHASSTTNAAGETVSRLVYKPEAAHAGSHITCTARPPDHARHALSSQPTPTMWVKSDSVPLNIMYKPEVQLDAQRVRASPGASNTTTTKLPPPPPFSPSNNNNNNNLLPAQVHTSKVAVVKKRNDGTKTRGDGGDKVKAGKVDDDVSLMEGEGAVLQCHVRANPPAYHVSWSRDGSPLSPGVGGGLVVGNMSVVLPTLARKDAATYTCTAHNAEGSSRSNPLHLHVIHGAECMRGTVQVLGVPRHHALNVTCQVTAYPLPTAFSWALKSSRGLLQVPEEMINFEGVVSWISYTPRAAVDYGELLCWAHTALGRQREPCVARLVAADKPDPPERCAVSRATPHTLTVLCTAAHDGGLPQTFLMTVSLSGKEVTNSTSVTSEITAYDLEPDTRYRLTLWSANTHGNSRRTTLHGSTAPSNTSTSSSMNGHASNTTKGPLAMLWPSLVAVVVVVTVLGVVMGVVLGVLTQRISVPHRFSQETEDEEEPQAPSHSRVNMGRLGESHR
ncbi:hypothetical protein OTU49_003591 [Cherax quadricarinatus]|uniref:Ig-like domain-containing protein n=1 Tax=Cherax quadricarinatus TaxID=27406 RepID=A0AAW0X4N0_CHEQU